MQHRSHALRIARMTFVFVFLLSLLGVHTAQAQDATPPVPPAGQPAGDPRLSSGMAQSTGETAIDPQTGLLVHKERSGSPQPGKVMSSGGPDYYGYTWSSATYSWIDAVTGGKKTGLQSYSYPMLYNLPFSFKFYENTYNQVYIATSGFMTFTLPRMITDQQRTPSPSEPNDVIAPYWTPIYFDSASGVYYKSGGTAPNRYFVVEWRNVRGGASGNFGYKNVYDFEAVLYENGDIAFQYKLMDYNDTSYFCGYAGIEDARGLDGLSSDGNCSVFAIKSAVRFTRPQPAARVLLDAVRYGGFAAAGSQAVIPVQITNTGELGSDAFDISYSCGWPVSLFDSQSGQELTDTTGNGTIDTGPVAQGASKLIQVKITMPNPGSVGQNVECAFWAIPGLDQNKGRSFPVSAAIPAPFWQTYRDNGNGYLNLQAVRPDSQSMQTFGSGTNGYTPSLAELVNGNVISVWAESRCISNCSRSVQELFYTIRGRDGGTVKGVTQLTNLSSTSNYAYDYDPSVAVTPDGTIGILWVRQLENSSYKYNRNIFFARLTSSGSLIGSPVNVTNDSTFADWSAANHHMFYTPTIAATGDNHFVTAWLNEYYASAGYVDNIYSAVYSSTGAKLVSPKALTKDTAGNDQGYFEPFLTGLYNNRVLLVYRDLLQRDIFYQVVNSDGSIFYAATNLSADGTNSYEYTPHAAQLSNGSVLVAWQTWQVNYAILDTGYNLSGSVKSLDRLSSTSDGNISVTSDRAGNGILTWTDDPAQYLYYALINNNGDVTTPGMAFAHSSGEFYIDYTGHNNASYTLDADTGNTDLGLSGSSGTAALNGVTRTIQVNFKNMGLLNASSITIQMTKPAGLIFGNISPAATCDNSTCTWSLPNTDLGFLGSGSLTVEVTVPANSTVGTAYPLAFHISSPEADSIAGNNDLTVNVYSGSPFFIPILMR